MRLHNCELNILVRGRKVAEFQHPTDLQDYFIEGRAGSEFEIEFTNRNSFRVEVMLSVDGLSVRDGKIAGDLSRGYLVDAYKTIRIPGWTLDNRSVAKFEFSGAKGGSYVEQMTGSAINKGVIGAAVYREAPKPVTTINHYVIGTPTNPYWTGTPYTGTPSWTSTCLGDYQAQVLGQAQSVSNVSIQASSAPTGGAATMNSMQVASTKGGASRRVQLKSASDAAPDVQQTLGTAFGGSASFETVATAFDRGTMLGALALFYDDARGLTARGIEVVRKKVAPSRPNPFPGMGCQPPLNWRG